MKHEESNLQQTCVKWFNIQYPMYWLIAIKNSSKMGGKKINGIPLEAIIAKREGVRAGVADLLLIYGNENYNGLFIEMKVGNGKQSKAQIEFEAYCNKNKYEYIVCRNLEQFMSAVNLYVKIKVKLI